ncbi:IS3 family transposase [Streptomyces pimonensis]|uniref:IS3 family transposase n=1 Tax=Streptomyces pimonensis TaxID=2860288 RepID=UPI003FA0804B
MRDAHRARLQDRPFHLLRPPQTPPGSLRPSRPRRAELKKKIKQVYTSDNRVYGARKIWRELNRQGRPVARCTVERLMRELGLQGAVRGRRVITTIPGGQVERAPDLVDRDFVAAVRTAAEQRTSPT